MDEKRTVRAEVLLLANAAVTQDRQNTYGSPEDNFRVVAGLWSAYMGLEFTAHDVPVMLLLLKVARMSTGQGHLDNYVDAAGYAACAAEAQRRRGEMAP